MACERCATVFNYYFKPSMKPRKYCGMKCVSHVGGSKGAHALKVMSEERRNKMREKMRVAWTPERRKKIGDLRRDEWNCEGSERRKSQRPRAPMCSKKELALLEALAPEGYKSQFFIIDFTGVKRSIDITSSDRRIWIESDGPWHFEEVIASRVFEVQQARDRAVEEEAVKRGVLLVRIKNTKFDINDQVKLFHQASGSWDGITGTVVKFY